MKKIIIITIFIIIIIYTLHKGESENSCFISRRMSERRVASAFEIINEEKKIKKQKDVSHVHVLILYVYPFI